MTRKPGRIVVVAALLFAGCGEQLRTCSSDADCEPNAACLQDLCVLLETPDLIVTTDRREARVGQPVRIDASASAAPDGRALTFSFRVEPDGAATMDVEGAVAIVRRHIAHLDVEVVVSARTAIGGVAERRIQIASLNSPPQVEIEVEPDPFQPGQEVRLVAKSSDPDGDDLTWEWAMDGSVGSLSFEGGGASLATEPGVEKASYPVTVLVRDDRGGEARASVVLQPRNAAPLLSLGEGFADHECRGDPLVCSAVVALPIEVEDAGPVTIATRLLDDRPDVGHLFSTSTAGVHSLALSCSPACRLAGRWTVEVTATDAFGAASTRQLPVVVGNRPPVVRAHDGSPLPHSSRMEGGEQRFVIVRPKGAVLVFEDPDGDPISAGSVEWTSPSELVEFHDPSAIDTRIEAVGSAAELAALEVAVVVADINGAEVADRGPLPVDNTPPTVTWGGDPSEGHAFVRTEASGKHVYRKEISLASLAVADADGDRVDIALELDPTDPEVVGQSLRLYTEYGSAFIEGSGSAFVGRSYRVIVRAFDAWGGTASSIASVLVSNRDPVIQVAGTTRFFSEGRQCQSFTCCPLLPLQGTCHLASQRVATYWATNPPIAGPLEVSDFVEAVDPDGDPLVLDVEFIDRSNVVPFVRAGGTWLRSATTPCTLYGNGWVCPVEIQLQGQADLTGLGMTCTIAAGTNIGASVRVAVRVRDVLGGSSMQRQWGYETFDDPAEPSCP